MRSCEVLAKLNDMPSPKPPKPLFADYKTLCPPIDKAKLEDYTYHIRVP